jgi:hypothetical protein
MKKAICTIMVLVVSSSISGCAKTWQSVNFPDQSLRVEDSGKARIYLICDTGLGTAVNDPVEDAGNYIGTIGPKSFLCWERKPGNTTISVNPHSKWTNSSRLNLLIKNNNVYYIQLHRWPGPGCPIYKLELINKDKGEKLLERCKPAENIRQKKT